MSYRNKSGFKFYSTQKALLNSEKKRFETKKTNFQFKILFSNFIF